MAISSAWAPTSATSASDSAYICSRAGRFLSELDELAFVMSVCIAWLQSFAARGDPMLGSEQEVQVIRTSYLNDTSTSGPFSALPTLDVQLELGF